MSRCQHGEMISIYCLHDTCTWRQAGGCLNCFKRYHSHPSNVGTINQQKLQQYCRKMIIRPDPKVKSRILQEALYNYFIIMKSHITSSIDTVSRVITNRLNYPYLYQEDQLDIFNKIKLKEYKKIQKRQLQNFCEFAKSNSKQDLQRKQREIYSMQVKSLQQHIKKINEAFNLYSNAIKDLDNNFNVQSSFVDKISDIINSILNSIKQENTNETDKSETGSKNGDALIIKNQPVKHPVSSSRDRDRKISFDITNDISNNKGKGQMKYNQNQLNERKKKFLQIDKQHQFHDIYDIEKITVNLVQKDVQEKEKRFLKSTQKSIKNDFSCDKKFKLNQNKKSRQNSDSELDWYQIVHTILPRQASKPKLYENTKQVKQKKIKVPFKISEQQNECSSPILKKKKTLKLNNQYKGFGLFKVQSLNRQDKQYEINQINEGSQSTTVNDQKAKQTQINQVLNQRQADSLALLVSSLACSAQQAIPKLQAALRYACNNLSAGQYLSYLYLEIGKPRQCLTVCNQFLQQIQNSSQSVRLAQHLNNNKAAALNMLGRYSESINIIQKCLQSSQKDMYYKNLGDAYFSIGIYQKSIINYEKALKLNYNLDQALFNLAVCLYIQGHFVEAQLNILKALKLNTNSQAYQQLNKQLSAKLNL